MSKCGRRVLFCFDQVSRLVTSSSYRSLSVHRSAARGTVCKRGVSLQRITCRALRGWSISGASRLSNVAITSTREMSEAQRPAGQQNTFYFEVSPLLTKIGVDDPLYAKLYASIPVVLVLGWTGALDHHVVKYKNMYSALGYHTLRFAPTDRLTFLRTRDHPAFTEELLELLDGTHKLTGNRLLVHAFSNASVFILYQHLIKEIGANETNPRRRFFQENQCGLILDSAIGWPTNGRELISGINGLLENKIRLAPIRYMVAMCVVAVEMVYRLTRPSSSNYFAVGFSRVVQDRRLVPTLSLYSTIDRLISAKRIEEKNRERSELFPKLYLKQVVYNDAEHVRLYAKHPEDYTRHVLEHLSLCGLDMDGILNALTLNEADRARLCVHFDNLRRSYSYVEPVNVKSKL